MKKLLYILLILAGWLTSCDEERQISRQDFRSIQRDIRFNRRMELKKNRRDYRINRRSDRQEQVS